jgi:hypothetical protein
MKIAGATCLLLSLSWPEQVAPGYGTMKNYAVVGVAGRGNASRIFCSIPKGGACGFLFAACDSDRKTTKINSNLQVLTRG